MNKDLLSNIDKVNETIGFGLCMSSGINCRNYQKRKIAKTIPRPNENLAIALKDNRRIQLTSKGILYADEIIGLIF